MGIPGYSLVDKFQRMEGAYAIAGVQRKLNFLLNGPPGTGKSKFVRTLSMYLQRHGKLGHWKSVPPNSFSTEPPFLSINPTFDLLQSTDSCLVLADPSRDRIPADYPPR